MPDEQKGLLPDLTSSLVLSLHHAFPPHWRRLLILTVSHLSPTRTEAATPKFAVLFDNAHAETAGNADWIISTSQPDPLAQNPNPQVETDWTGGIPASSTSATLNYFWYMTTTETSHSFDFLNVEVRSSSGTVLKKLQTISDGSTAGSWQSASFSLNAYIGQTVQIAFVATNGSINPTSFFVDDVAVQSS